jgi:hypothetical protein
MSDQSELETPKKSRSPATQLLSPFSLPEANAQRDKTSDSTEYGVSPDIAPSKTTPVGLYWSFHPMEEHPPRYAPKKATAAEVHMSSNVS